MAEKDNPAPKHDIRDPDLILGTILSGLEMFNHENLLAVAPEMLKLAGRSESLAPEHTEEELRNILCNVARSLHKHHPKLLKAADDLIASIQLAILEEE